MRNEHSQEKTTREDDGTARNLLNQGRKGEKGKSGGCSLLLSRSCLVHWEKRLSDRLKRHTTGGSRRGSATWYVEGKDGVPGVSISTCCREGRMGMADREGEKRSSAFAASRDGEGMYLNHEGGSD